MESIYIEREIKLEGLGRENCSQGATKQGESKSQRYGEKTSGYEDVGGLASVTQKGDQGFIKESEPRARKRSPRLTLVLP